VGSPRKQLEQSVPAAPYEPTAPELRAIAANAARREARTPFVPLKVLEVAAGKATIQIDHKAAVAEALFCEQLGTDDSVFASYVAEQLGMLSRVEGDLSANVLNAHLSTVRAIAPRDEVETLLACQMAAVHVVTMSAAASLTHGTTGAAGDLKIAQLNKLSRTFAAQMEALKRYRSKGDQRVMVEHVHVHEGGQAVVGNVTQGKSTA